MTFLVTLAFPGVDFGGAILPAGRSGGRGWRGRGSRWLGFSADPARKPVRDRRQTGDRSSAAGRRSWACFAAAGAW